MTVRMAGVDRSTRGQVWKMNLCVCVCVCVCVYRTVCVCVYRTYQKLCAFVCVCLFRTNQRGCVCDHIAPVTLPHFTPVLYTAQEKRPLMDCIHTHAQAHTHMHHLLHRHTHTHSHTHTPSLTHRHTHKHSGLFYQMEVVRTGYGAINSRVGAQCRGPGAESVAGLRIRTSLLHIDLHYRRCTGPQPAT